jgi:transposase
MPLMRQRAELLAQIQHTNSPYHRPEIHKKLAYQANRGGVAERFPDPVVQQSIDMDLTLIDSYDRLWTNLGLDLVQTAKAHDAQTFYRLRSLPGVGTILSPVLLYNIHKIRLLHRVQACTSYGRLVTCAKDSAGKRSGTSGKKIGKADLKWAFSEAAGRVLRNNPAGQKSLARLERKPGQGKT